MTQDISRICYVYGLKDPISSNIRYIGKGLNPKLRLKDHLSVKEPGVSHKDRWIISLRKLGLIPELIIMEITTFDKINDREKFWIAEYRSLGFNLTNQTAGGDGGGVPGWKPSEETKRRMSKSATGRKASEEARINMSRAASISHIGNTNLLGYKHTEEAREKMSKSQTGNKNATGKRSSEARLKMSLAKKEFWAKRKENYNNGRTAT